MTQKISQYPLLQPVFSRYLKGSGYVWITMDHDDFITMISPRKHSQKYQPLEAHHPSFSYEITDFDTDGSDPLSTGAEFLPSTVIHQTVAMFRASEKIATLDSQIPNKTSTMWAPPDLTCCMTPISLWMMVFITNWLLWFFHHPTPRQQGPHIVTSPIYPKKHYPTLRLL